MSRVNTKMDSLAFHSHLSQANKVGQNYLKLKLENKLFDIQVQGTTSTVFLKLAKLKESACELQDLRPPIEKEKEEIVTVQKRKSTPAESL